MSKIVLGWLPIACLTALATASVIAQQQPDSHERVVELFQQARQAEQTANYVE